MRSVYFIKPIGLEGPIKIGCSERPMSRCEALDVWSPFPLEVLAELEGSFSLERRFHAYFAADLLRKEWFEPSAELMAMIAEIRSGTFDIATLPPPKKLTRSRGWTDEQKLNASYSHRVRHAQRRSGYFSPVGISHRTDEQRRQIETFIATPHVNGRKVIHHWATAARRAYHARLKKTAT